MRGIQKENTKVSMIPEFSNILVIYYKILWKRFELLSILWKRKVKPYKYV